MLAILVLVVLSVNIGSFMFDRKVKKEVERMFAENQPEKTYLITEADLADLPASAEIELSCYCRSEPLPI